MRAQGGAWAVQAASAEVMMAAGQKLEELPLPMGGEAEGPGIVLSMRDLSDRGPGGSRFLYIEDPRLDPNEDPAATLTRPPGPGEPGFVAEELNNLFPAEHKEDVRGNPKAPKKSGKRRL
jgi:hypothetical protein